MLKEVSKLYEKDLQVDELARRISIKWRELVCGLGELHTIPETAWQYVTICYNFIFG
jgi:hypothetical protein